jgi:hypothetical protein
MSPAKDDLLSNIESYFSKMSSVQNIAAQQTTGATQEHYLKGKSPDLGMAKHTVKVAKDLDDILKKTNKKYKEAVEFQIKSLTVSRQFANIRESNVLDKEIKILEVM